MTKPSGHIMQIQVVRGTGAGPTALSAFDAALHQAGISNYNLINLSSVIPPSSNLVIKKGSAEDLPGEWGDRLYVVMAEKRVTKPGGEAWAGIGWVQDAHTGRGLFVEHEGSSEKAVRGDIQQSLEALMKTRGIDFGPIHMEVVGVTCEHEPVSALVVAIYQASGWASISELIRGDEDDG